MEDMPPDHLDRIDCFVIGGSAGAFGAVRRVLSRLPRDFPASILVCIHQSPFAAGQGAALLRKQTGLNVQPARDGAPLDHGTVYVAVPDTHLVIGSDHIHLRRGAHENNFRPAIDPLFRSAAVFRGPRAVAIVLSGLMDDGAAGARAVNRTGGKVLVQDPETADYREMPDAVIAARAGAEVLPLDDIASRMIALAGAPCAPMGEVPWQIGLELKITTMEAASMKNEERLGTLTPFNCPHCNGVLWEIEDGPMTRYRCHTGHAYTATSLSASQEEALDFGLFNALRASRGRAELIRRIAGKEEDERHRERLENRAKKFEEDAEHLEALILQRTTGRDAQD